MSWRESLTGNETIQVQLELSKRDYHTSITAISNPNVSKCDFPDMMMGVIAANNAFRQSAVLKH